MYNTHGVTVRAAKVKEDPIRIVVSALGGEEVCRNDATSRRSFADANLTIPTRLRFTLISRDDGGLETAFELDYNVRL